MAPPAHRKKGGELLHPLSLGTPEEVYFFFAVFFAAFFFFAILSPPLSDSIVMGDGALRKGRATPTDGSKTRCASQDGR
jgi:hypothetical protein